MVTEGESRKSPRYPSFSQRSPNPISSSGRSGENGNSVFSPRFKSIAAMAGWDEETLLIASLIVDDTPEREFKQRKRSDLTFKTPPSSSRRKRRDQRIIPAPVLATVLNLDEEEPQEASEKGANGSGKKQEPDTQGEETKTEGNELPANGPAESAALAASLSCLDRLREELSCAICLEICYEPSTTACGHSYCKKCLRSAAEKCGKRCPKCRQLISSGRSSSVNTVLWNTIQLLFPKEVESRKASGKSSSGSVDGGTESDGQDQRDTRTQQSNRRRIRASTTSSSSAVYTEMLRRRRAPPSQDEDAALALRLQREEFMGVIRGGDGGGGGGRRRRSGHDRDRHHEQENSGISLSLARENLRAMASRAISLRARSSRHM